MPQKYKTKNTRQFKRLKAFYLMKYSAPALIRESRLTNINDISAGGLKFSAYDLLPEGTLLKVDLLIPTHPDPLEVNARVVRLEQFARRKGIYSVACKFTEISRGDQLSINEFIERLSNDEEARIAIDQKDWAMRRDKAEETPS